MAENVPDQNDLPEIELMIKASTVNGRRRGACLFCHEYFMELYLLAEIRLISLKVSTIDTLKYPEEFRRTFGVSPPPILVDNGLAILDNEKIETHIMKNIPGGHNLFVHDKPVSTLVESVYSKLKLMLTMKDDAAKGPLVAQLKKIDHHLAVTGFRFLTGDTLSNYDCELMPRLQHIRVAGIYFHNFDVPHDLIHLWCYIHRMYSLDAFTQSCPADQDLIGLYKMQQGQPNNRKEELNAPTYNTSIPAVVSSQFEASMLCTLHINFTHNFFFPLFV